MGVAGLVVGSDRGRIEEDNRAAVLEPKIAALAPTMCREDMRDASRNRTAGLELRHYSERRVVKKCDSAVWMRQLLATSPTCAERLHPIPPTSPDRSG